MPNPEEGCKDLKRIFVDHIYLNTTIGKRRRYYGAYWESWGLTTAISGVHTIGSAKLENSGYTGHWSRTPDTFDNEYYKNILDQGWGPKLAVNGNPKKNQWKVIDLGAEQHKNQMMLNSDMCLSQDDNIQSVMCDNLLLQMKSPEWLAATKEERK